MSEQEQDPFVQESKERIKPDALTVINLDDIARFSRLTAQYLRRLHEDAQESKGSGQQCVIKLELTGGGLAVQIDFEESEGTNVDVSAFELPERKLHGLTIYNYGPGLIKFSTNKPRGRLEATVELEPGEDTRMEYPNKAIKNINIVAPDDGNNAKVKLIGIF